MAADSGLMDYHARAKAAHEPEPGLPVFRVMGSEGERIHCQPRPWLRGTTVYATRADGSLLMWDLPRKAVNQLFKRFPVSEMETLYRDGFDITIRRRDAVYYDLDFEVTMPVSETELQLSNIQGEVAQDAWTYVTEKPRPEHGGQVQVSYMLGHHGPFIGMARYEKGAWRFTSPFANPSIEVYAWKELGAPAPIRGATHG